MSVVPRLCCLVSETDDLSLLPDLAAVGVDGFQVRAKGLPDRDLLALAQLVIAAVRPVGASVMVNDRVDVALAAGADGVHLGAEDLPVRAARRLAPDLLVGATCRDAASVARAAAEGASYAGFGPVFASASKPDLPPARGVAALRDATGALPIVAIGGIDPGGARAARAAGASGVAVLGAIWRHPDPVAAAKELVSIVGG